MSAASAAPYHPASPPPHSAQPPAPARPRPQLTGSVQMVVIGLAVLAGASILLLRYLEVLGGPWVTAWAIAAATAMGVLALGVIAGALAGRGSDSLTVLTAVLTIPLLGATGTSALRTSDWDPSWAPWGDGDPSRVIGTPQSGYDLSFTESSINLTSAGDVSHVPVDLSFSTADLIVPDDRDVFIDLNSSFSSLEGPNLGTDSSGRIQVVDAVDASASPLIVEADLSFSTLVVRPSGATTTDTGTGTDTITE